MSKVHTDLPQEAWLVKIHQDSQMLDMHDHTDFPMLDMHDHTDFQVVTRYYHLSNTTARNSSQKSKCVWAINMKISKPLPVTKK